MILSNYDFSAPITFDEDGVCTLVIENPVMYRSVVSEMLEQANGAAGDFVLSENGEMLDFSKDVCIITDVFCLEHDTKAINSKVLQSVSDEIPAVSSDAERLIADLNALAATLAARQVFDVGFHELYNLSGVLKLFGFSLDIAELSLPERRAEYISFIASCRGKRLFVILHLKSLLSDEEQELFFKTMRYKKIPLLLLETHQHPYRHPAEKLRVIDADLCEIG